MSPQMFTDLPTWESLYRLTKIIYKKMSHCFRKVERYISKTFVFVLISTLVKPQTSTKGRELEVDTFVNNRWWKISWISTKITSSFESHKQNRQMTKLWALLEFILILFRFTNSFYSNWKCHRNSTSFILAWS
jgi:hypothetical protein